MTNSDDKEFDQTEITEITDLELSAASTTEAVTGSQRRGQNPWVLLVIGLLVGGLAGFFLYPLIVPIRASNAAPLAAVEESDQINKPDPHQAIMLAVADGSRHFQGEANAPVTLVEFGDFNCGYCARWAKETLPLIDEK